MASCDDSQPCESSMSSSGFGCGDSRDLSVIQSLQTDDASLTWDASPDRKSAKNCHNATKVNQNGGQANSVAQESTGYGFGYDMAQSVDSGISLGSSCSSSAPSSSVSSSPVSLVMGSPEPTCGTSGQDSTTHSLPTGSLAPLSGMNQVHTNGVPTGFPEPISDTAGTVGIPLSVSNASPASSFRLNQVDQNGLAMGHPEPTSTISRTYPISLGGTLARIQHVSVPVALRQNGIITGSTEPIAGTQDIRKTPDMMPTSVPLGSPEPFSRPNSRLQSGLQMDSHDLILSGMSSMQQSETPRVIPASLPPGSRDPTSRIGPRIPEVIPTCVFSVPLAGDTSPTQDQGHSKSGFSPEVSRSPIQQEILEPHESTFTTLDAGPLKIEELDSCDFNMDTLLQNRSPVIEDWAVVPFLGSESARFGVDGMWDFEENFPDIVAEAVKETPQEQTNQDVRTAKNQSESATDSRSCPPIPTPGPVIVSCDSTSELQPRAEPSPGVSGPDSVNPVRHPESLDDTKGKEQHGVQDGAIQDGGTPVKTRKTRRKTLRAQSGRRTRRKDLSFESVVVVGFPGINNVHIRANLSFQSSWAFLSLSFRIPDGIHIFA